MLGTGAKRERILLLLTVLAFSVYAVLFIYRTSFFIEGKRYFSLFDDAMISMRYAKNLAEGEGLVWNPDGERVEGTMNFLWVLYMAFLHLFPIDQSKISILVQASGAFFLIINLFFVRKIARSLFNRSFLAWATAVLLTAFYYPLSYWSLLGMEVSVLTLILTASVWKALQCCQGNRVSVGLYLLLGTGMLIRIDFALPYLGILCFLLLGTSGKRGKNLLWGGLVFILFALSQTLFRLWYFGEVLPNPFYLKMAGYPLLLRLLRGLYVFLDFLWRGNWALFLFPLVLFLFQWNRRTLLLFWVFIVQILYSIFVGGDAWEEGVGCNRFIGISMPLFFLVFGGALGGVQAAFEKLEDGGKVFFLFSRHPRPLSILGKCAACAFLLISLLSFNSLGRLESLGEWLLLKKPYYVPVSEEMVKRGLLIKKITSERAKIGVFWAGAVPYFSERHSIDFLGTNDRRLAREEPRAARGFLDFSLTIPGHSKWNYEYSIGELKPDVITELKAAPKEAMPFLENYLLVETREGFCFYLLKGSSNIFWNRIRNLQ